MVLGGNGTVSKMRAWAAGALPNGMIQEQLACGCMDAVPAKLDQACGRVMGDVSSMFIVYLLELLQWTGDTAGVRELWPAARAAATWQMARANTSGLPDYLIDTYDGLGLNAYNASAFSGFFHLLAMKAARKLALSPSVNDTAFAARCTSALARGQKAMDDMLWNASGGFYRSYTQPQDPCGPDADGAGCWHTYSKGRPGSPYTEEGGLCCHGGSGCGPHNVAAPAANATFAEATAACDALANCSSFCFTGPESDLKPTRPVQMMWKTGGAGFTPNPSPVGGNAIMADCTCVTALHVPWKRPLARARALGYTRQGEEGGGWQGGSRARGARRVVHGPAFGRTSTRGSA